VGDPFRADIVQSRAPGRTRPPLTPVEQARRGIIVFPVGMLFLAFLTGLPIVAWWHAQVTDVQDVGQTGFTEGDPFPWIFVVLAVASVGVCLVLWARSVVRWRRLRRPRQAG
jgi:hypothetical protein